MTLRSMMMPAVAATLHDAGSDDLLVVLPHDAWHMLTADPVLEGEAPRRIFDGDGPFTTMVCGYFDFRAGGRNPVLAALPQVIVVDREAGGSAIWIRHSLE